MNHLGEIRKDYFSDEFVIIKTKETKKIKKKINKECEYCPGNEDKTILADMVLVQSEGSLIRTADEEGEPVKDWCIRAFQEKNPIVTTEPERSFGDHPLYSEPGFGHHYIVIATPNHKESLDKIPLDQWINVLISIQEKSRWLYSQKGVSYVSIYSSTKNGSEQNDGHSHFNLITLPRIPPIIEKEANNVKQSINEFGLCPMCRILNIEMGGPRQIIATDLFFAFTPWASSKEFEFWIFPKKHQTSILKVSQTELEDLAIVLRSCLGGLSKSLKNVDYTIVFHMSSEKKTTKQLHWHIEIYPKTDKNNGIELASGINSNEVSPEKAAEILSLATRKQIAELLGVS